MAMDGNGYFSLISSIICSQRMVFFNAMTIWAQRSSLIEGAQLQPFPLNEIRPWSLTTALE